MQDESPDTHEENDPMADQIQAVEQAVLARVRPHRSFAIAFGGVLIRGVVWGLLIFGLAKIVPIVLPALKEIQPKLQLPKGAVMEAINVIKNPQISIPVIAAFLLFIDLPISYLTSNSFMLRRWWGRLMFMIPMGIGLAAGGGFLMLYIKTLKLMMKDAGMGG